MVTEEAPVKVSDSREGLVADKRGVNSSVSLSLQGAGMTDHPRLEGYRTGQCYTKLSSQISIYICEYGYLSFYYYFKFFFL